jgi:D-beta-D-heptose 7-phosphate kinase/D-beta-D-heptose 1-phosphate adenosyltransferase
MDAELKRMADLLERFPGRRILIVGDAMLDHYIWGETSRISPEAPVPVVGVQRESSRLGGAANVAHNVKSLGGEPLLVAVVGRDAAGSILRDEMVKHGIATEHLFEDPDRPTIKKTRVIARGQQVVRIDREDLTELAGAALDALSQRIEAVMVGLDAVVISDYGKGVISKALIDRWLPRFADKRLPVCVDPKETHFHSYRGVTVLTPNVKEASFAAGRPIRDEASLAEIGRVLLAQLAAEHLLITRGEEGVALFGRDGSLIRIPAVGREVYDVTGAGDTVVSAIAMGLAAGLTMEDATRLANHAAGRVIRESGTVTTTCGEILESWRANVGVS